jgi:propanol-preferring alcohol dehydrogenase
VTQEFGRPPRLAEVPEPVPGPGEVLVRVRAVGICGTDVKIAAGAIPGVLAPLVQGHEVAGEVVQPCDGLVAGQRVAAYIFQPCGVCAWCRRGQDTLCAVSPRLGFERDGGLAEYLLMRPQDLLPFSDDLSFAAAAVAMDAVLSPWRALRVRADIRPGDRVLVVGAGGLGLHAVQIAVAAGCSVAVLDPDPAHRAAAEQQGAELVHHPDALAEVLEWSDGGVDVAMEASGVAAGFAAAGRAVRTGGTLVCCGYRPGADFPVDSTRLALGELTVLGSRGGTVRDARDALAAVERGELRPLIAGSGQLDQAPEFIDRLGSTGAVGRLVVELP